MNLGVDCSNPLDGPTLIDAGYGFAVRYLSRYPGPKRLGPPERDSLLGAGVNIVLCYEDDETDAFGGALGGARNGSRAADQALVLDAPANSCLYLACDRNNATADMVRPYYYAARGPVLGGGYRLGFYGAWAPARALLAEGTVDCAWVVESWGDGLGLDAFHLMQYANRPQVTVGGVVCDENLILAADYGAWYATPPAPPAPPVVIDYPGDNMKLIKVPVTADDGHGHAVSTDDQGNGFSILAGVAPDSVVNAYPNTAGYIPLPHFTGTQDQDGNARVGWSGPPHAPPFEAHVWVASP